MAMQRMDWPSASSTLDSRGMPADSNWTNSEVQAALAASLEVSADDPKFVAELRARLGSTGAVVVPGFPVDDAPALVGLAACIGCASTRGNGNPPRLIHDVTASPVDPSQPVLGSRLSGEFRPHTDSCGYVRPHAYLMLACVVPDPTGGGLSTLTDIGHVVDQLTADERRQLAVAKVPFWAASGASNPVMHAPVLKACKAGWRVRYRADSLVREACDTALSAAARSTLARFEAAVLDAPSSQHLLRQDDVLVIDNRRILHGRTGFAPDSPRLLRRLKVHLAAADESLT